MSLYKRTGLKWLDRAIADGALRGLQRGFIIWMDHLDGTASVKIYEYTVLTGSLEETRALYRKMGLNG